MRLIADLHCDNLSLGPRRRIVLLPVSLACRILSHQFVPLWGYLILLLDLISYYYFFKKPYPFQRIKYKLIIISAVSLVAMPNDDNFAFVWVTSHCSTNCLTCFLVLHFVLLFHLITQFLSLKPWHNLRMGPYRRI